MSTGEKPLVVSVTGSFSWNIRSQVEAVGGKHAFVPSGVNTEETLREWYEAADAVLLCGGADINPRLYGQEVTHARGGDPYRDWSELLLASWALDERKPLMGICRGHQMVAVAAGMPLHQDVDRCLKLQHNGYSRHRVNLKHAGMRRLYGENEVIWVNSLHHQAVADVPVGFNCAAVSMDGVIEGLCRDHVLTTQYHPEALGLEGLPPFRWLLARARQWGAAHGRRETPTAPEGHTGPRSGGTPLMTSRDVMMRRSTKVPSSGKSGGKSGGESSGKKSGNTGSTPHGRRDWRAEAQRIDDERKMRQMQVEHVRHQIQGIVSAADAAKLSEKARFKLFETGFRERQNRAGRTRGECPHKEGTERRKWWLVGYDAAWAEENLGRKPTALEVWNRLYSAGPVRL